MRHATKRHRNVGSRRSPDNRTRNVSAFAALALPCLRPAGRIVAMKGAEAERELVEAERELAALGLACTELRQLRLPASGARRCLLVLQRR